MLLASGCSARSLIQSGLTRLGRGELDVRLDLPEGEEFKGLGTSFEAVSAQLSAVRAKALPSPSADFESVVENLEDAVALFNPDGELIFCNPAMGSVLPQFASAETRRLDDMAPSDNPVRQLIERTLAAHRSQGPVSIALAEEVALADTPIGERRPDLQPDRVVSFNVHPVEGDGAERLLMTHPIDDASGKFVGAMLVARNLGYLNQVHSTLNYSRKLAALGRLMAGVAHEVKNPLNAMTIHLELLRQKLTSARQLVAVGGSGGSEHPRRDQARGRDWRARSSGSIRSSADSSSSPGPTTEAAAPAPLGRPQRCHDDDRAGSRAHERGREVGVPARPAGDQR